MVCLVRLLLLLAAAGAALGRATYRLDLDWRFALGDLPESAAETTFNDSAWRAIDVPHDFVVEGNFTPDASMAHGYLPFGVGWYRKHFVVPAEAQGKSVWLTFDGTQTSSKVWLNGQLVGTHPHGYTTYRFPLLGNAAVKYGQENVLAVRVDCTDVDSWWYDGGGIYRHVWLEVAENVHVAPWGVWALNSVSGTITYKGDSAFADSVITPETTLENDGTAEAQVDLLTEVVDQNGVVVAKASSKVTLAAKQKNVTVQQKISLAAASLWSTVTPVMYTLKTTVSSLSGVQDVVTTPFGIRKTVFDADKGFFLNDKPVKIVGFANHQDFAGLGVAIPDTMQLWRVKKMKEMGANGWRTAHNPPNAELLDACDREGMLVWDENHRSVTTEDQYNDLRSMLYRDRNHPSIIYWSVCNELLCDLYNPVSAKALMQEIHRIDHTRPVAAAMNLFYETLPLFSHLFDVLGFNYNIFSIDAYHKSNPTQPLTGSETSSALTDRGIYVIDEEKAYMSAYDVSKPIWGATAQDAWESIASREFMQGCYVWTGFDYKGEPTPYKWPNINSHFGILDIAGFPKDAFYLYQAFWKPEPILHILPHWNDPVAPAKVVDIWAYTNLASVELFVNGQSQGKKDVPLRGHAEWTGVTYVAGELHAVGYCANGTMVAEQKVQTTGVPARIVLEVEDYGRTTFDADRNDVALIKASIVDSLGRVVPTASNFLTFSVSGGAKITGVGNGDPSSHEPDKASTRSAWNGLARAIVGATGVSGTTTVTASSPGLSSGSVAIKFVAPKSPVPTL